MTKRYYFGGNYYSEQDVIDQATADGISVSSYLKQNPEIREESIQDVPTGPTITKVKQPTKKTVKDSINEILKEIKSGNLNIRDSEFTNMSKLTEKVRPLNNYQFDETL